MIPPLPPPLKSGPEWSLRGRRQPRIAQAAGQAPLFSVVIPSYNQAPFLEAAIRSVLLQDFGSCECIVIDGGSTDGSVDIIRHYAPWLAHGVSERDRGQAHAINKGLALARGAWLAYLNSDDLLLPWTCRVVASVAQADPQADLIHGDRMLLGPEGEVLGWTAYAPYRVEAGKCTVASETAFWPRRVQERLGGFDETLRFAIDSDFYGRIYRQGRLHKVDRLLGCLRGHPATKTATLGATGEAEYARVWGGLFGAENVLWHEPPGKRGLAWRYLLLNPRILTMPYLAQRIRRSRA